MRTRGVFQRLTSVEEVQASLRTFGGGVATLLDERSAPPGDGATPVSHQRVFDNLGSDLETARLGLVGAEDEHVRQQVRISNLQDESDRLVSELYDQQVAVRQTVTGLFGAKRGFELTAVSGSTPRARKDLEEQVDQTVKLLKDPAIEVPPLRVRGGVEISLVGLAEGLEAGQAELHAARTALLDARKAGARTLLAKYAAMADFDRVFPAAAGILERFFRLAGEVELADRIRTAIRRVTRRQGAEDEEVPEETAPPAGGEPGDGAPGDSPAPPEPAEPPPSPA
jgi:hypothetical protein